MKKRKLNKKMLIASLCVILFLVCYGKIAYEAGKRSVTSDRETQSTSYVGLDTDDGWEVVYDSDQDAYWLGNPRDHYDEG